MIKMKIITVAAGLILIGFNALLPLSAESSEKPKLSEDTIIKIIEKGVNETDKSKEICTGFNLTEQEVKQFFKQSEIISFKRIHDSYNWLPCYVRGTYAKEGKIFEWDINAGGFAILKSSDSTTYLGCEEREDCENLFQDKQ